MATRQIPQEQWKAFLDETSREFESGQITVEVRGQNMPQQDALSPMPLIGLSYEDKGSGKGRIDIIVGNDTDTNVSHTVAHPTRVLAETTPDGRLDHILIDADQGEPITTVRFLSAT